MSRVVIESLCLLTISILASEVAAEEFTIKKETDSKLNFDYGFDFNDGLGLSGIANINYEDKCLFSAIASSGFKRSLGDSLNFNSRCQFVGLDKTSFRLITNHRMFLDGTGDSSDIEFVLAQSLFELKAAYYFGDRFVFDRARFQVAYKYNPAEDLLVESTIVHESGLVDNTRFNLEVKYSF